MSLQEQLERSWCQPNWLTVVLWPLSLVYQGMMSIRHGLYAINVFKTYRAPIPVVVVGNLTVGGVGKTPLVIYLVKSLCAAGFKPAVIARGYGGNAPQYPYLVTQGSPVDHSGDEPLLIYRNTDVPVVIGADRRAAIEYIVKTTDANVIVSDDGLQHLALARDIVVCVTNEALESNNTQLLPAGPYREPISELNQVDYIVDTTISGTTKQGRFSMSLQAGDPKPVSNCDQVWSHDKTLHLVAGIGNPERFFAGCDKLGYTGERHVFPDHHTFVQSDIDFAGDTTILMTEKDAVKCEKFADHRHWYLPVSAKLQPDLSQQIIAQLSHSVHI